MLRTTMIDRLPDDARCGSSFLWQPGFAGAVELERHLPTDARTTWPAIGPDSFNQSLSVVPAAAAVQDRPASVIASLGSAVLAPVSLTVGSILAFAWRW